MHPKRLKHPRAIAVAYFIILFFVLVGINRLAPEAGPLGGFLITCCTGLWFGVAFGSIMGAFRK